MTPKSHSVSKKTPVTGMGKSSFKLLIKEA